MWRPKSELVYTTYKPTNLGGGQVFLGALEKWVLYFFYDKNWQVAE